MLKTVPHAIIGNRYDLQRELARGGMGSVWVAKDSKLKRLVAIKVMVPMWVSTADATQRFEREAMAVAQLQSPHVVQIFDYGVEQQCPYIVMELLEGEDLRQRLQRENRIDLETAGRIMVQAAKALSAAHNAGIIHRDLKPGNIFLVRAAGEELVKVLDFGVAKVETTVDADGDEPTRAGTLLGTPQYMSPEQARGAPDIDHRADLWSLAVILYRGLTGQLPFVGKSAADVIVRICTRTPPTPSSIAPDLPAEIDRFFERALANKKEERFENARQMAVAFARVAPSTFPSLTLPGTSLEGADIHLQRAAAAGAGGEPGTYPGVHYSAHSGVVPPPRPPPRKHAAPAPGGGPLGPSEGGILAAPEFASDFASSAG
ncbi:MAG: serine/threonine protein kinase, partial [Deltaproteobacteria bacterium]|nr:serine/threonine protein kinase [Deltaproteobacteria bacterium]MBW2536099.1 serine/threonine protein kinase [Deltaproteobacteria bacterium]